MPIKLHQTKNVIVFEDGEPNLYTLLKPDNRWIMQIKISGTYLTEKQRLMIKEIANVIEKLEQTHETHDNTNRP